MALDFVEAFNQILKVMVLNPAYLIFLIIFIAMIPLSFFGILKINSWLSHWRKLRAGYIKVRKKLSNGRWIEFWARPTGRKIKVKGEEGLKFEIPVKIEKGFMGYQSKIKGNFKLAGNPTSNELRDIVKGKTEGFIPENKRVIKIPNPDNPDYKALMEANK